MYCLNVRAHKRRTFKIINDYISNIFRNSNRMINDYNFKVLKVKDYSGVTFRTQQVIAMIN